jgi:hypothetical protein
MVFVAIVSIYCGSLPVVQNPFPPTQPRTPFRCQSNVAECQDERCYYGDLVAMTREELKTRLDELARKYVETQNPEIAEELYQLARELEKIENESLE